MLTTIENLRNNGFEVIEVLSATEALAVAKGFVEPQMHIGIPCLMRNLGAINLNSDERNH
jgi:hypothetical protein